MKTITVQMIVTLEIETDDDFEQIKEVISDELTASVPGVFGDGIAFTNSVIVSPAS